MERRYQGKIVVSDPNAPGEFILKCSTQPGMSVAIGELKIGDISDIYNMLGEILDDVS